MMHVRPLPEGDFDEFISIAINAYPGFRIRTEEDRKRLKERFLKSCSDPRISLHGCYRDETLVGGIRLHDFVMNVRGTMVPTGGGGVLAVDLVHKKEHVGKQIMLYFFRHYRGKKSPVAALWPFRPDFYRRMGAGYGGKIHQYRVKPEHLPAGSTKEHVRFLSMEDAPAIVDCYNRFVAQTTGMIEDTVIARRLMLERFGHLRCAGYTTDGGVDGYVIFHFESAGEGNFIHNDLIVQELIYHSRDALAELMTFLHTQADQINRVVISTADSDFHHFLHDPRNENVPLIPPVYHQCHASGIGVMYRVLDVAGLFEVLKDADFNHRTKTVAFRIRDTFLPENDGRLVVRFADGQAHVEDAGRSVDFELTLDIADFSSLVMGTADIQSLYHYGRVEISDAGRLGAARALFQIDHSPVCMTDF